MVDIGALLSSPEDLQLECKLAAGGVPNSLWETYSSFANTAGGVILLGVEEKDKRFIPRGVADPGATISDIWSTLNNTQKVSANILFDRQIYSVDYNGAKLIVMKIPPRQPSRQARLYRRGYVRWGIPA